MKDKLLVAAPQPGWSAFDLDELRNFAACS
ncbi:hypothetical protein M2109_005019 [Paenibacillus sp. PastH-3]|nr:hypothetical protein [Paenibacillus sp. PastH-4]MDH6530663.1 hypothetical protein [Paenibacillus sp. PastH-3]